MLPSNSDATPLGTWGRLTRTVTPLDGAVRTATTLKQIKVTHHLCMFLHLTIKKFHFNYLLKAFYKRDLSIGCYVAGWLLGNEKGILAKLETIRACQLALDTHVFFFQILTRFIRRRFVSYIHFLITNGFLFFVKPVIFYNIKLIIICM